MKRVRAKKHLGQHFLSDVSIAETIVEALRLTDNEKCVLEIGAGTGVLSDFLVKKDLAQLILLDIDQESIRYLSDRYAHLAVDILQGDFLSIDTAKLFSGGHFSIIGNFPYNISSQIFFKILNERNSVDEVVCMIQKETAERIASGHGSRACGILSVLLQAYYKVEYLFSVAPEVFSPRPKVDSAVLRLERHAVRALGCDEELFKRVVKAGFQQRRKTLRNALKALHLPEAVIALELMNRRAEQLSIEDFIDLTNQIQ